MRKKTGKLCLEIHLCSSSNCVSSRFHEHISMPNVQTDPSCVPRFRNTDCSTVTSVSMLMHSPMCCFMEECTRMPGIIYSWLASTHCHKDNCPVLIYLHSCRKPACLQVQQDSSLHSLLHWSKYGLFQILDKDCKVRF